MIFIIIFISQSGGIGPWWRSVLSESFCSFVMKSSPVYNYAMTLIHCIACE